MTFLDDMIGPEEAEKVRQHQRRALGKDRESHMAYVKRELVRISKANPLLDLAKWSHNAGLTEADIIEACNGLPTTPQPLLVEFHNKFRDVERMKNPCSAKHK